VTSIKGIRAEESPKRRERYPAVTKAGMAGRMTVFPVLHWSSDELWAYLLDNGVPYSHLYDEGFHRLGCVGCPMIGAAQLEIEFSRWPIFREKWRAGIYAQWARYHGTMAGRGGKIWWADDHFSTVEEMWDWWVSRKQLPGR